MEVKVTVQGSNDWDEFFSLNPALDQPMVRMWVAEGVIKGAVLAGNGCEIISRESGNCCIQVGKWQLFVSDDPDLIFKALVTMFASIINEQPPLNEFPVTVGLCSALLLLIPASQPLYREIMESDLKRRGATDVHIEYIGFGSFKVRCRHPKLK
jgi:hypothetical protein